MSDPEDPDMLAAEYVLGTLDGAEREAVAARLGADDGLALAVRAWEDRLSPLVGAVPEVEPPAGAYAAIASRLFGSPDGASVPAPDPAIVVLRRRVRRWQGAAAGFALLAAAMLGWIALREAAPGYAPARFAAVLQRDAGAPAMLVDVDVAARRLTVRPLAAAAPAGRSYELWIIDPSLGAPRSLGVLPAHGEARDSLKAFDAAVITGATYAVTVEAPGGSPTGQPTTSPVLSGRLTPFGS
ncbi:anti-sigma factor [Lichenibacterium dinghuense]|uniref:anti-sigma factor n=1 Tax=Lichenibacterium dinghuense TaxID=2895977 RepID=UPI001F01F545|nr:anti-sigma factor [Lichenibacterium sp. 6Y81]